MARAEGHTLGRCIEAESRATRNWFRRTGLRTDDPHGSRPRKAYRLTDQGRAALDDWLRSERMPGFEFRDEGLLRLFFADALPLEDAIALVRRLRVRAQELERDFHERIFPLAQAAPGRFLLIAAREGGDYFSWRADWFRRVEAELVDELNARQR